MSFYSFFSLFSDTAIKEVSLPYHGVADFIEKQLDTLVEKYAEWQQQEEEQERRQRKRGA